MAGRHGGDKVDLFYDRRQFVAWALHQPLIAGALLLVLMMAIIPATSWVVGLLPDAPDPPPAATEIATPGAADPPASPVPLPSGWDQAPRSASAEVEVACDGPSIVTFTASGTGVMALTIDGAATSSSVGRGSATASVEVESGVVVARVEARSNTPAVSANIAWTSSGDATCR